MHTSRFNALLTRPDVAELSPYLSLPPSLSVSLSLSLFLSSSPFYLLSFLAFF